MTNELFDYQYVQHQQDQRSVYQAIVTVTVVTVVDNSAGTARLHTEFKYTFYDENFRRCRGIFTGAELTSFPSPYLHLRFSFKKTTFMTSCAAAYLSVTSLLLFGSG